MEMALMTNLPRYSDRLEIGVLCFGSGLRGHGREGVGTFSEDEDQGSLLHQADSRNMTLNAHRNPEKEKSIF